MRSAAVIAGALACLGRRARVERVRYMPTWVRHPDYTVLPAGRGTVSWRRTVATVGRARGLRPCRRGCLRHR